MRTLKEGDAAPPFLELTGNKGSTVILYFYPKDFTPGCTTEACDFRDLYDKITEAEAVVIGVSPDAPESHEKFIAAHGLPYSLVADGDHAIAEAYGVWKEKSMYGRKYMGIERSTFIIGPDGRIKKIFRKVKPAGHAEEVLTAIGGGHPRSGR
ncbi:MAG TPA: peroxiredoxin [Verrucomicrobiae bacterium]|nr:peroxiredoxin [Verrucomicrobiae bacterium]